MRRSAALLLPLLLLVVAGCGVPLQSDPEPLPSDLLPTSTQVSAPVSSESTGP